MVTDIHDVLQNMRSLQGQLEAAFDDARRILSVTEQYWCPVRHAHRVLSAHERYPEFFSCGDAQGYQQGLQGKRYNLRQPGAEQFPDEGAS